ncbi:MAG TPA: hypothetical protein VFA07_10805 [Chthonomonadaceae bacterium]|nr:hypothetical protein [Chthonomonadaceae bacterium]
MRIGLQDIDLKIAQAMEDRLSALPREFLKDDIHWGGFNFNWQFHAGGIRFKRKREPNADERQAYELRKKREERMGLRIAAAIFLPILAALIVSGLLGLAGVSIALNVVGSLAVWLGGALFAGTRAFQSRPKAYLQRSILPVEMRAVVPLLSLSRAERTYCDTLLLLARMEVDSESEKNLRATLEQLNDLLASARQLESRRLSLLPVLGTNSAEELEAELETLRARLAETTDHIARQSLEQSVQMCAARLENARVFEQGLERLKAQEEALVHTLASVQTAVARMQLTPMPQTALAAQEIAETVSQMNQQTYAVEQAVQEVMELRQG